VGLSMSIPLSCHCSWVENLRQVCVWALVCTRWKDFARQDKLWHSVKESLFVLASSHLAARPGDALCYGMGVLIVLRPAHICG